MTDTSAEQDIPAPRYDFEGIDMDSDSVHADVVRLVGKDARVLELGPATGYMSKVLVKRGCTVVGIELDPAMAERAEEFCERVIVGDFEKLDLEVELADDRFDVVVAADFLEHLRDPLGALCRLRVFLKPGGAFVISVPNVAHGSVRLALLSGHFDYREIGLLDSTHLRFFTRETFEQLLDEAELGLAEFHRHDLNFEASEVDVDLDSIPPDVREKLEHDPDARTYQFVAKAVPMAQEGLREIQSRLRELTDLHRVEADLRRAEAARDQAEERSAELEKAMAEIAGREGELRRALIDAHDQLLRRDTELQAMHEVASLAETRAAEIVAINDELVAARVGLERIRASAPFRLYSALQTMPVVRTLRRRRQAAFEAEVAKRTGPDSH